MTMIILIIPRRMIMLIKKPVQHISSKQHILVHCGCVKYVLVRLLLVTMGYSSFQEVDLVFSRNVFYNTSVSFFCRKKLQKRMAALFGYTFYSVRY